MTYSRCSWRTVPMPERVAARPRTPSGIPVPYVAGWEGEESASISIDPVLTSSTLRCRYPAVFSSPAKPGGRATLGVMEPARQRRAMVECRCQVCELALTDPLRTRPPWRGRLWLVDLRRAGTGEAGTGISTAGQTWRVGRRMVPLVFEPWVCEDCLVYALEVCPGILKAAAGRTRAPLRLLHVRSAQFVAVVAEIKGDGPVAGQHAVSYVKAAVTDYAEVPPATFLAERGVKVPDPYTTGAAA